MSNRIISSAVLILGFTLTRPAAALISRAELNAQNNIKKAQAQNSSGHFRVVLDPGHGGIDQGTAYEKTYEKNLTLVLAQKVAKLLRARGIEVILTRDMDHEMPLAARTALANKLGANAFISIHMNSLPESDGRLASGSETYILNNASDGSSKRLAQLENMVMAGEAPGDGSEPGDVALILKDLRLDANLPESKRLACMIQNQMVSARSKSKAPMAIKTDRGVRQALFFVLLGADMPSALVEAGFLSNPTDRAWLSSEDGQNALALAIARGINLFRLQKNTPEARKILNTCKVH